MQQTAEVAGRFALEAAGQAHEALHAVLAGSSDLGELDALGDCSGWDSLAGALAVLRTT